MHLEKVVFGEGCEAGNLWIWKGLDPGAVPWIWDPGSLRGVIERSLRQVAGEPGGVLETNGLSVILGLLGAIFFLISHGMISF